MQLTVAGGSLETQFGMDELGLQGASFGLYRNIAGEGIKPLSGIKDISVEYKGGYKAIRQATINWTCNSLLDLDYFTPHFLTVGKTILLDWGWIMKDNLSSTFFDINNFKISEEAFTNPMPLILENKGNYDAMAGVISNFGYDLNDSGGFDCVTTMTSVGVNLFDSQSTSRGSSEFKTGKNEEGDVSIEPHKDGLINAIINLPRIITHDYFGIPFTVKDSSNRPTATDYLMQILAHVNKEPALYDQIFYKKYH